MLSMRNVSVVFNVGQPNEVHALRNFSLDISEGEFVTVIGMNGSGKSTLFNAISGSVDITAGKIELDGVDITRMPEYKRSHNIGRVFQDPLAGTCAGLTVRENLSLAAIHGRRAGLRPAIKAGQEAQFIEQLELEHLGLEYRLDADVGSLSGGQRQAITLVMATLAKPQLLLLDEHTAALDPNATEQILALTKELAQQENFTVLMITHSMEQACDLGDRVLMMGHGEIALEISGEDRAVLTPAALIDSFHIMADDEEYESV